MKQLVVWDIDNVGLRPDILAQVEVLLDPNLETKRVVGLTGKPGEAKTIERAQALGFEVHTSSMNKSGAADVILAYHIASRLHLGQWRIVLVSADQDFCYLVEQAHEQGHEVIVAAESKATSKAYIRLLRDLGIQYVPLDMGSPVKSLLKHQWDQDVSEDVTDLIVELETDRAPLEKLYVLAQRRKRDYCAFKHEGFKKFSQMLQAMPSVLVTSDNKHVELLQPLDQHLKDWWRDLRKS